MSFGAVMRNKKTWLIGIPVLLVVLFVGGPFVYIHFIEGDPPAKLKLQPVESTKSNGATSSTAVAPATIEGAWKVKSGSAAQYRVPEILFGQSTTAVGKTSAVTGDMTISGTTVENATFTADLTKVSSDQANRDRQFQGRIMDTATFPTATFKLTAPIELGSVPANGKQVTVEATGDLTLRGKTKSVTFDIVAQRDGDTIETNGTIPITFDDYGIPAVSFGPAEVGGNGELVFLINFAQA
ncbi:MAG: YceI family protein [Acidimicrobiia bacterium]